ncbi:type II TA system antitoxin MqsA family protein [Pseudomonas asiatica]|uniref:type II TA system antitoxin MqsA family protein n=1 Tax=Pseudomonas asiatica TaxID=2219225 RepID=UPI002AC8C739|nr:type II TA system antitoxin MqsA family protein [Pseudomonas asiatica]
MKKSPESRAKCPNCGANDTLTEFTNETREFGPRGHKHTVSNLSGLRCDFCDEVIYSEESISDISSIIDELAIRRNANLVRHVRKDVLNLTQKDAVNLLSGGGHNAFSRYEKGLTPVPKPLMVLIKLLEKNPNLLDDIKKLRIA